MQLVRAVAALLIIGGVATAETMSPPATDVDCPFAKAMKPQRILLLDPIQKHPIWIDARLDSPGDVDLQRTVDSSHAAAAHGVVTS
ncbi:MAG TPA: hypothetical protein VKB52_08530 [Rhodanobacteraceae bacterium]|nr:hypothetical protein [Rhodanobacteraceae bacterium]